MATLLDFLGLSPRTNGSPRRTGKRTPPTRRPGRDEARSRRRPAAHVLTRDALENAVASVAATGGSTNGVLHLLAIAYELGIDLTIDDFDLIANRNPVVADMKPGGRLVATDLYAAGGVAACGAGADEGGPAPRGCAERRRTLAREVAAAVVETPGQEVVVPIETPLKETGRPRDARRQSRAGRLRREARRPRAPRSTAGRRGCSTRRRTASPP